jgi:hypothetical protein
MELNDNLENQDQNEEPETSQHNSLIRKFPLSFDVSLLLVLLRESLEQFDQKGSDDHCLILKQADIYEMLKTFYPVKNDETLLLKKFDAILNKVLELGFLKEKKKNVGDYEVRRVLKAFFDASKLKEIKEQMKSHLTRSTHDN